MKRLINCQTVFLLVLTILLISHAHLVAQVRVTRLASEGDAAGKKGVVYALPRTEIEIGLKVTKISQYPGPLAEYAREFLGIGDPVVSSSVHYRLDGACIMTTSAPDPDQIYLIEKEDKSQGEIWISFGKGTMRMENFIKGTSPAGFDHWNDAFYIQTDESDLYSKYSASATREVIDTIVRKVSIDTLMIEEIRLKRSLVEYPDRDKAQDAMDRINRIEADIYNILIGYQETAYSKDALEFMYTRLMKEKQEYISLFTGASVEETLQFTYRVIPNPQTGSCEYNIAGFSDEQGLVEPGDGNLIRLIIEPCESDSNTSSGQMSGGVVYRVPFEAGLRIEYNDLQMASHKAGILQFGALFSLPSEFKKFELNLETGELNSLVME